MPTIIDRETATPQTDMWEWGGKKTFRAYTFLTSVCLINFICFTQNLCLFFSILFNNIIMILCTELEIHQCAFPTFSPLLSYLLCLIFITDYQNDSYLTAALFHLSLDYCDNLGSHLPDSGSFHYHPYPSSTVHASQHITLFSRNINAYPFLFHIKSKVLTMASLHFLDL